MTTVRDLTSDELRAYMADHRESDYLIVDVRQPEEYAAGHVPGAKLVPLMELPQRAAELEAYRDKDIFFYCRSGGRSSRAAQMAATGLGLPQVHNLLGGITGYRGEQLPDFPQLKVVDLGGGVEEVLLQALELEKGAHRLYDALGPYFEGTPAQETIEELAKAEVGHGKVVYAALAKLSAQPADPFEKTFDDLPGELLEGGDTLEAAVGRAREVGAHGPLALLELALEIELRAFDLYKNLADHADDADTRATLLDLAQQEKRHAEGLAKKLGSLAAS
jgi:rhodanese-related sulfurtransferase/rubrerythrin